ncbi:MAG TPA: protein serine phosphatase, partial [Opitutae bacterium]|nr:protein serine phosphatase [Opitutae bacterium]
SIHFGSKDALLLYTDGITEIANNNGDEYGSQRLTDLLRTHGDKGAQELVEQTLESVHRFSQGTGQLDDLTLIAVKHA